MQDSTIPLITAITVLGIITLLFFVNEFFRKYKIVKKRNRRKRKRTRKIAPTIKDVENAINLQLKQWKEVYDENHLKMSDKQFYEYERGQIAFSKWYKDRILNKK